MCAVLLGGSPAAHGERIVAPDRSDNLSRVDARNPDADARPGLVSEVVASPIFVDSSTPLFVDAPDTSFTFAEALSLSPLAASDAYTTRFTRIVRPDTPISIRPDVPHLVYEPQSQTTNLRARPRIHLEVPSLSGSLAGVDYHTVGRAFQNISLVGTNAPDYSSTMKGFTFAVGHSFPLHQRPILKIVHVGLDVTWFDAEYGYWRRKLDEFRKWMYKLDVAVGVGPAIHLRPSGRLNRFAVHIYGRFHPTMSLVAHNIPVASGNRFELVSGYASYASTGVAVSWDAFSVGAEWRFGGGRYRGIRLADLTVSDDDASSFGISPEDLLTHQRHRMRGSRLYVSFRF
jgi:hypothetical protein